VKFLHERVEQHVAMDSIQHAYVVHHTRPVSALGPANSANHVHTRMVRAWPCPWAPCPSPDAPPARGTRLLALALAPCPSPDALLAVQQHVLR
jgi:hypothetical protein